MKKTKLLIIDDQKLLLEGTQSILSNEPFIDIIYTVKKNIDALKLSDHIKFDSILIGINEINEKIFSFINSLKKKLPFCIIIIMATRMTSQEIHKTIQTEVNGIILKETGKAILIKAFKETLAGNKFIDENIKKQLNTSMFPSHKLEKQTSLSNREKDVLRLISNEKNSREIAEILNISFNTVETHRKNLMRKLGTKNVVGLVKYALLYDIT